MLRGENARLMTLSDGKVTYRYTTKVSIIAVTAGIGNGRVTNPGERKRSSTPVVVTIVMTSTYSLIGRY